MRRFRDARHYDPMPATIGMVLDYRRTEITVVCTMGTAMTQLRSASAPDVERAGKPSLRAIVILCAMISATVVTALAQTGQIEVTNAWARATPGSTAPGAAYLTIVSPVADRLIGVSSPIAKSAQLHTMTMQSGVMRMRPITGIDLPAGKTVTLKPGGMHIMLTGLTGPLKEGQSFPLTLSFKSGGTKEISVTVNKIAATKPAGSMGGMPMPMHH
jgi:periplasmic copper chaperone A